MTTDYQNMKDVDGSALWIKGLSRFRRWLFPALAAAVILVLIIVLGASNMKTANRLQAVEQSVSSLSDVVQSLNASLQQNHETAKDTQQLQFAVENNKEQLISVVEAVKQLSVLDSLSRTVASLKCSLEHIINNSSVVDSCCPLQWEQFDSSCLFFSRSSWSWNESRVRCEQQGAHLLVLHSDREWDFVTRHTVPEFFWVGLSDWRTGRWEWVNETPYSIERRRWVPGQPDNYADHEDCAHLHNNGRLNDLPCATALRYICQKHSVRV